MKNRGGVLHSTKILKQDFHPWDAYGDGGEEKTTLPHDNEAEKRPTGPASKVCIARGVTKCIMKDTTEVLMGRATHTEVLLLSQAGEQTQTW